MCVRPVFSATHIENNTNNKTDYNDNKIKCKLFRYPMIISQDYSRIVSVDLPKAYAESLHSHAVHLPHIPRANTYCMCPRTSHKVPQSATYRKRNGTGAN